MSLVNLSDGVEYVPKSENPLSAEAFIIRASGGVVIYDVGASDEAFSELAKVSGDAAVVLSHFHADHSSNIRRLKPKLLFGGGYTCKKFGGEAVAGDREIFGAHLFSLPSSHAKGCLGLEYNGLAFLGDGTYSSKDGFNAGVLRETIDRLEKLSAEKFVLSHSEPLIHPKSEVVGDLKKIYDMRKPGENFIVPW